ncbi:MAG TPA: PQQ-binding-like beta-propeller repeat protein [Candidatus Limnocylindria bacterium]|nr:PQQ-binding-like beta-propeller repeat protein [Candidatus Limnocylindria bacterium]
MNHQLAVIITIASLVTSTFAANFDWPQWRGPNRDDLSKEIGLLNSWPEGGPKRVWLYENGGNGYSGPAIANGKLFTLGTRDNAEVLLALDANTGTELWVASLGGVLENKWGGGPRGTPAVDGDRVYSMSGKGNLACVNVADGKLIWQKEMTSLGGKVPGWGYTESVLADGNHVLCTPGGSEGAIAALNKKTGDVVWRSTEFTDGAQYSSLVPARINGTPQYIQLTMQSIVGVSAKDGKVLWKAPWPGKTAVIPTPIVRDSIVYVTSGYGVGCKEIKIGANNEVTTVFENKVMKNHHGGVILVGDYIYGHADAGWTCQNFTTGEEVWNHRAFGKGAVGYADGMLYCIEEGSGTVALVEASPKGWQEHGRFKLDPQTKIRNPQGRIWTHPVISNGKLYLRDQDLIFCYDIKKS